MYQWIRKIQGVVVCLGVVSAACGVSRAALAQDIAFSAKLVQTTCTIGTTPAGSMDLNAGGKVLNGDTLIGQDWKDIGQTAFAITLTGCNTWSQDAAKQTPAIKVSGTTLTTPNASDKLFRTSGSSQGFGLVVYNNDKAPTTGSAGNQMSNNSYFNSIPGAPAVLSGSYTLNTFVAVACGQATWCTAANLRTGRLRADMTFTFEYK